MKDLGWRPDHYPSCDDNGKDLQKWHDFINQPKELTDTGQCLSPVLMNILLFVAQYCIHSLVGDAPKASGNIPTIEGAASEDGKSTHSFGYRVYHGGGSKLIDTNSMLSHPVYRRLALFDRMRIIQC
jgi:hypothetical protein